MLKSVFARFHPHVRAYCALLLAGSVTVWSSPYRLAALGIVVLAFAAASGVRLRTVVIGILPVASLIAGAVVLALFSGMAASDIRIAPIVVFAVKCWTVYTATAGLFAGVYYADAVGALDRLRVPALLTSLAASICRWFEVVRSEAMKSNTARVLRGGDLKTRYAQIKDLAVVCASVMTRSYLRAERVAAAMECRGFDGRLVRLSAEPLRTKDLLAPVVCGLIILGVGLVLP
ncbi:MAG: energy-coupling factor transporter transmembrane component T [Armatimonadota bacterium]|nr:energy-coupling factor transporter transmembrane component T [Armatimonadota bacterium]